MWSRSLLAALLISFGSGCAAQKPVHSQVKAISPPQLIEFREIEIDPVKKTAVCYEIGEMYDAQRKAKVILCSSPYDPGQLGLPPKKR